MQVNVKRPPAPLAAARRSLLQLAQRVPTIQAAAETGIHQSQVSRLFRGQFTRLSPNVRTLLAYAANGVKGTAVTDGRPSTYATMQKDVLERMDYALESKLWQAIGSNLDLTATVGQSWRVSELLYTDNRHSGFGRLGVNIDLFDGSNLELAYGFNTTDGPLASHFRFSQGPTLVTQRA